MVSALDILSHPLIYLSIRIDQLAGRDFLTPKPIQRFLANDFSCEMDALPPVPTILLSAQIVKQHPWMLARIVG